MNVTKTSINGLDDWVEQSVSIKKHLGYPEAYAKQRSKACMWTYDNVLYYRSKYPKRRSKGLLATRTFTIPKTLPLLLPLYQQRKLIVIEFAA